MKLLKPPLDSEVHVELHLRLPGDGLGKLNIFIR